MKTIEVIYPEFQNVYADLYQVEFLKKCSKGIKVVYTHYNDKPHFLKHKVDMIFMGSMPDSKIIPTIQNLKEYTEEIKDLIENGTIFLVTGNAIEIFGKSIKENNNQNDGLSIFDYKVLKNMEDRIVTWYLGTFNDIDIIGHKNQFSLCYGIKDKFLTTIGGVGSNREENIEGIHYKNFYGTYLLGPLLIMNPLFAKHILRALGLKDTLIFEEDLIKAYERRHIHFRKPGTRFIMADHG